MVGAVVCDDESDLLTVTTRGYGKRTPLREYLVHSEDGSVRAQSRGGKGRIDIKTEGRNGRVVAVRSIRTQDDLMFISRGGMIVRVNAGEISQIGRNTQGVRVIKLREDDQLIAAAKVVAEGDA